MTLFKRKNKKVKLNDQKHWLSGKNSSFFEENHINLKNNHPFENQNSARAPFNATLPMNLDSDIFYSVDIGDNQQSPLIQ
jgi:hypothetical protein